MTRLAERWRRVCGTVMGIPVLRVVLRAIRNYVVHQSANQAGSLAFSSVLSAFPLLLLLSSAAAYLGQPGDAAALVGRVMGYAPQLVRDAVQPVIDQVIAQRNQALLTIGLFATLWTASSGMQAVRTALNKAYGVEQGLPFWKARIKVTLFTLVVGAGTLVAFSSVVIVPHLSRLLEAQVGAGQELFWLRNSVRYGGALLVLTGLYALSYGWLPDMRQRLRTVLPGAVVGAALWVAAAAMLSYTLQSAGKLALLYGGFAGVVATLVFLYISGTTLIFGAEVNGVLRGHATRTDPAAHPAWKLPPNAPAIATVSLADSADTAPAPAPTAPPWRAPQTRRTTPACEATPVNTGKWTKLVKDTVVAWSDDYAPSMGAAISYYTLFSLAPLLVLVIAVAGLAFGAEAVRGQISAQLSALMGADTAEAIEGMVESATVSGSGIWATVASVAVLLVGATSVFSELQAALDRIWHVPESRKPSGIWGLLRARLFSLGLILGLAFLLMVSLAVSAGLAAFGSYIGGLLPGQELLLQALNTVLAVSVTTVLFAMIFKLMPTARVAWRDVWVGAVVTALLFEVGKLLIGLYLGKSALANSFAGAGALVVLLAWVYYAAQIFLLGAEFTKVYAYTHGSARDQEPATPVQLSAADAGKTVTAPEPAAAAVSGWTARAARELLPKLALLGGLVLLRIVVESRAKRERRLVRKARN